MSFGKLPILTNKREIKYKKLSKQRIIKTFEISSY